MKNTFQYYDERFLLDVQLQLTYIRDIFEARLLRQCYVRYFAPRVGHSGYAKSDRIDDWNLNVRK